VSLLRIIVTIHPRGGFNPLIYGAGGVVHQDVEQQYLVTRRVNPGLWGRVGPPTDWPRSSGQLYLVSGPNDPRLGGIIPPGIPSMASWMLASNPVAAYPAAAFVDVAYPSLFMLLGGLDPTNLRTFAGSGWYARINGGLSVCQADWGIGIAHPPQHIQPVGGTGVQQTA
jgi:hypothetical protein